MRRLAWPSNYAGVSALMLVAVLSNVPVAVSDGDSATMGANLVIVDGGTNPATTLTKLVQGQDIYVKVNGLGSGTFTLNRPDGSTAATVIASNGVAMFEHVDLSPTGTWTVKLVDVVTTFGVIPFDSSLAIGPSEVMSATPAQIVGSCSVFQCPPSFDTQTMNTNGVTCSVTGDRGGGTLNYAGGQGNIRLLWRTQFNGQGAYAWAGYVALRNHLLSGTPPTVISTGTYVVGVLGSAAPVDTVAYLVTPSTAGYSIDVWATPSVSPDCVGGETDIRVIVADP